MKNKNLLLLLFLAAAGAGTAFILMRRRGPRVTARVETAAEQHRRRMEWKAKDYQRRKAEWEAKNPGQKAPLILGPIG